MPGIWTLRENCSTARSGWVAAYAALATGDAWHCRGVPRMSPTLLSRRLHQLTRAGIVDRHEGGGDVRYVLTAADPGCPSPDYRPANHRQSRLDRRKSPGGRLSRITRRRAHGHGAGHRPVR
jgi:hypothetical protein